MLTVSYHPDIYIYIYIDGDVPYKRTLPNLTPINVDVEFGYKPEGNQDPLRGERTLLIR